jgi:hypothetical protein
MINEAPEQVVNRAQEWFENRFNPPAEELVFRAMDLKRMYGGDLDRKKGKAVDALTHHEAYELARWFAVSTYLRTLIDIAAGDSNTTIDGRPIHDIILEERNLVEQAMSKGENK